MERPCEHLLVPLPPNEAWSHQHRTAPEDRGEVACVGHVRATIEIGERVGVAGQQVPEVMHLGALCAQRVQHDVVLGHEPLAVDRSLEAKGLERLGGDGIELDTGPVHDRAA